MELLRHITLVVLLLLAASWDLKTRRIPNWLSLSGWGAGLILAGITAATGGEAGALFFGMVLASGALLLFYLGGGIGGGDVKLALGVGLLAGYPDIVNYLFYGLLAALALILGRLAWRGELWRGLKGALVAKPRILRPGTPEADATASATGETKDGETVPAANTSFAVAWLLGVAWVWLMEGL